MPKLLNKFSKLSKYSYRITVGQVSAPSVLALELTNNCNSNCVMCGRESILRQRTYMNFDLFQEIVKDAKANGVQIFQLSFYGEPLLYPKMVEAVQHIHDQIEDATIVINTNATLLNKTLAKQLLDAGMSLFSISIDGNNKEEFEEIRVGLKWDVIRQNVMDLHALIQKHKYPAQVHIRGLNMEDYPLDAANFHALWSPYANEVFARDDHQLHRSQKESLAHRLYPCDKIFNQLIIMVDGRVTICAYDWEGQMSYGKFPNKSIKQLWRTQSLTKKRRLHLFGMKKTISFCKTCTYRAF